NAVAEELNHLRGTRADRSFLAVLFIIVERVVLPAADPRAGTRAIKLEHVPSLAAGSRALARALLCDDRPGEPQVRTTIANHNPLCTLIRVHARRSFEAVQLLIQRVRLSHPHHRWPGSAGGSVSRRNRDR